MIFTFKPTGEKISGNNFPEILTALRTGSKFDADLTDSQFMIVFANRQQIYDGRVLRIDSPQQFVQDLLDKGILA